MGQELEAELKAFWTNKTLTWTQTCMNSSTQHTSDKPALITCYTINDEFKIMVFKRVTLIPLLNNNDCVHDHMKESLLFVNSYWK